MARSIYLKRGKDKMKNKIKKAALTLMIFAAMTVMMAVPVFAAPVAALPLTAFDTMLGNIKNLVLGIVVGIGAVIFAFGLLKLGMGFMNRDAQSKVDALGYLIGGGIMMLGSAIIGIILAGTGINF